MAPAERRDYSLVGNSSDLRPDEAVRARRRRPDINQHRLPNAIAHADWGVNPSKRWVVRADLGPGDRYTVHPPRLVGSSGSTRYRMGVDDAERGPILLGFDFPIGLPLAYATVVGISSFPDALSQFGSGDWGRFWDVAVDEADIDLHRPFYPFRPGGRRQIHLTDRLGLSMGDLTRGCERATDGRRAACALFWTLGGNQVGKGALSGWREMLQPARRPEGGNAALWPFDGTLHDLLNAGRLIIAETYPSEFYGHLGVKFSSALHGGKRSPASRRAQSGALLAFTGRSSVLLTSDARSAIEDGFGDKADGEDRFDAMVGLLGMLNVVQGGRAPARSRQDSQRMSRVGSSGRRLALGRPLSSRESMSNGET